MTIFFWAFYVSTYMLPKLLNRYLLTSNHQEETGLCIFNMGRTLYLGGMPDGSVPSVKGTFAPVDHSE